MASDKVQDKASDVVVSLNQAKEALEAFQRFYEAHRLEPIEKLSQLVRAERKKQKLSRVVLAALCEVSPGTIMAIESGKESVSLENVQKVLKALGRNIWIK